MSNEGDYIEHERVRRNDRPRYPVVLLCTWRVNDDGCYESSCKQAFEFTCDGPKENHFAYCPYCGKRIKDAASEARKEGKP